MRIVEKITFNKRYKGIEASEVFDFSQRNNDYIVLVGKNGSGKSRILDAIYCYYRIEKEIFTPLISESEYIEPDLNVDGSSIDNVTYSLLYNTVAYKEAYFISYILGIENKETDYTFINHRIQNNITPDFMWQWINGKLEDFELNGEYGYPHDIDNYMLNISLSDENKMTFIRNLFAFMCRKNTMTKFFECLCECAKKIQKNKFNLKLPTMNMFESSVQKFKSIGQQQLFCLDLIFNHLADDKSLILLDEPDASIDYSKKLQLIDLIKNCKSQVILTTHDPVLVSHLDPSCIFMLDDGKISENQIFARVLAETDSGYNMLDALGMQGKPYIVVVEGPSDLKIIQRTIEILSNSGKHKQAGSESKDYKDLFENVIFLNLGGTGNIEHFFKDTLPYYMKTNVKKILFLFDRDDAGYTSSHIVEKEKKNNNIYDFYLYCEPGKTENDYNTNASHKNCENLFYLEDYVPLDSIEVEGRKATFWDNGKQIPFHVLKFFEDGKKSDNKKQDSIFVGPVSFGDEDGIVNNLKIKYEDGSYFSGDITRSKITSIVSSIKNQTLNKTNNNYNYYRNFQYLVDDILDKLFLSDEEYKVRHCKLYKNEVNNPYNADCIEDMILWETERKKVSASFSQLDKYKEILNKVKDKIGITELDINNPLWSCMYNVIASIKFENGCRIFDCSDKQIEQFRKMYETNNHLVI